MQPTYHVIVQESASEQPTPDERGEVRGYWGLYNFRHHFWVAPGSRVYGPKPHLTLNHAQDLHRDFSEGPGAGNKLQLLLRLLKRPRSRGGSRVLTALEWSNAANSKASDEATSIVQLAIAFESLLGLPAAEKTDRIVDAISLLLGRVPRLDVWAQQFYDARSQIVHEGRADEVRFRATAERKHGGGDPYRSLTDYGREIFRLCVNVILTGQELAERAGLKEKFVTNAERFEQVCRVANNKDLPEEDRLSQLEDLVEAIDRYKFSPENELELAPMIDAAQAISRTALASTEMFSSELRALLETAITAPRSGLLKQLEAIGAVADALPGDPLPGEARHTKLLRRLMGAVWHYTFRHYYWLRQASLEAHDG